MDVKVLSYFIALEECGHYAPAAKKVFISPQGLSAAIKHLETEVGVPLFNTNSGTITLTDYGRVFSKYAHEMVSKTDEALARIGEMKRRQSKEISLLTSVGLINCFPDDFIQRFNETNAQGTFVPEVRALPDIECEQWLDNLWCDFALINKPIDLHKYSVLPIMEDNMFAWIRRDNPLADADHITVADLSDQHLVELATDYKQSVNNERVLMERAHNYSILHVNEMIQILDHVITGGNVGLVVRLHAEIVDDPRVVAKPIEDLKWGFSLCWLANRILSEADMALIKWFSAAVNNGEVLGCDGSGNQALSEK